MEHFLMKVDANEILSGIARLLDKTQDDLGEFTHELQDFVNYLEKSQFMQGSLQEYTTKIKQTLADMKTPDSAEVRNERDFAKLLCNLLRDMRIEIYQAR